MKMLKITAASFAIILSMQPAMAKNYGQLEKVFCYVDSHISTFSRAEDNPTTDTTNVVTSYGNDSLVITQIIKPGHLINNISYMLNGKTIDYTVGQDIFYYIEESLKNQESEINRKARVGNELPFQESLVFLESVLKEVK